MRDSRGSVAVIYPLLSCLVLTAWGDRPGRQETESGWLGLEDGGVRMGGGGHGRRIIFVLCGGKHVQVAGEIICLDCFCYNKLCVLTSGYLNGEEKAPRAGQADNDDRNMVCEEIWWQQR